MDGVQLEFFLWTSRLVMMPVSSRIPWQRPGATSDGPSFTILFVKELVAGGRLSPLPSPLQQAGRVIVFLKSTVTWNQQRKYCTVNGDYR